MRRSLVMAALLCVGATPAAAHHSLAPYIRTVAHTVTGVVKEFDWTNPHTRLVIMVSDESGKSTEWTFEGVGISRLTTAGFKKGSMAAGDRISVSFNPRRDGANGGMFVGVTLPNGKTLKLNRYQQLQNGGYSIE